MITFRFRELALIVPLAAIVSSAAPKAKIEYFIQPWLELEERGSWKSEGRLTQGLHRAKAGIEVERKVGEVELASRLSLDFGERSYGNLLENAWVEAGFHPLLNVKVGRFKVPFGAHNRVSSSKLVTVHRSFTTDHLKDELLVLGYRSGVQVHGEAPAGIEFGAGLFDYPGYKRQGLRSSGFLRLPVAFVEGSPREWIRLQYMIAAPNLADEKSDGRILERRVVLHDVGVAVSTPRRYEGFLDVFFGIDTADGLDLRQIRSEYLNDVVYSLYTSHSFNFSLPRDLSLQWTTAFEYLNGLDCANYHYVDRSYYMAVTQVLRLVMAKKTSLDLSFDRRFDRKFSAVSYNRVAVQVTSGGSIKFDSKKVKAGGGDEIE